MQDELVHQQIGDFYVDALLEQRSSMRLYRATQQSLKRFVQLKVVQIDNHEPSAELVLSNISAYIKSIIGLEHLHLQPIYAYGAIGETYIYVAGRFPSGTLHDLLLSGALPKRRALELAQQIVLALAFIHSKGFVHRSLSPYNIYLDESGGAYVNDLELAEMMKAVRSLEELKDLLDEPFYASVEQLEIKPQDFRSEAYSFGAILYHMVTGVAPFSDGDVSFEAVLERKRRNQLIPPRQLNAAVTAELDDLIMRMLRANPAERLGDINVIHLKLKDRLEAFNVPLANAAPLSLVDKLRAQLNRLMPR